MPSLTTPESESTLPRPVPESYWLVPGRLLVGAHPGSRSRATAMDRLRRFLASGFSCFIDLTEPHEVPSYEALLPFATPEGRRVEYVRMPIVDHGVPAQRDDVAHILRAVDDALQVGHLVYLHCRAGIGRSALVAGCWLAERRGDATAALDELQGLWKQASQSKAWPVVPETEEQSSFVQDWLPAAVAPTSTRGRSAHVSPSFADQLLGAWRGLALGDATGAAIRDGTKDPARWTQHTALTICLAESLLAKGAADPRDQIERYVRWQKDGAGSADGEPGKASPDVAKALATYRWRGQPMAGSHDPKERLPTSLPRVLAAVSFELNRPAQAVELAGESSRTTHQSPIVIDACRYYAAMLLAALQGLAPEQVLAAPCEPEPGLWAAKPLKRELMQFAKQPPRRGAPTAEKHKAEDVLLALGRMRSAVLDAPDFPTAVERAVAGSGEPSLDAALAGTMYGALHGSAALPQKGVAQLAGRSRLDELVARLLARSGT